jgi:hypothetical protein
LSRRTCLVSRGFDIFTYAAGNEETQKGKILGGKESRDRTSGVQGMAEEKRTALRYLELIVQRLSEVDE